MRTGTRSAERPDAVRSAADVAAAAIERRSQLWFRAFVAIFSSAMRKDFHAVRLARTAHPPPVAIPHLIVYCNHPSWWDAAVIAVLLGKVFSGRRGFAPIDAAMIARYGFMTRIGAFGVVQHAARGAAMFLAAGRQILAHPDHILFVTAQGRFTDTRERPVRLAPGLVHLVDHVPDATLVPLAIDYPFWDERKPELLLRFGAPIPARAVAGLSRAARHDRLARDLEATMDALAADAMARDAAAFTTLLDGGAGVGGIYDLWRRAKAAARGERFVAAHRGKP